MRLYDWKIDKHNLYLICEFIDGNPLSDIFDGDFVLSEQSAKIYMHRILSGVNNLHSRKIIHRDIKLENLI